MKPEWNEAGDVPASKEMMRDIIQHKESTADTEVAEGEVWHPEAGQYPSGDEDAFYGMLRSGLVKFIMADDPVLSGAAPAPAPPATPTNGQIYVADGVNWDPLNLNISAPYSVYYDSVAGAYRPSIDAQYTVTRRRQMLLNGAFQVAQRGVQFNVVSPYAQYTFDRWYMQSVDYAGTVTQEDYQGSGIQDPTHIGNYVNFQCAGSGLGTGSRLSIEQRLPIRNAAGGFRITLQFEARSGQLGAKIGVGYRYYFGDAVTPTKDVSVTEFDVANTGFAEDGSSRYIVTFDVPKNTNTLGNTGTPYFSIILWLAAGSTFTGESGFTTLHTPSDIDIGLTNVQLEVGDIATAFAVELEQDQLEALYRYYTPLQLAGVCFAVNKAYGRIKFQFQSGTASKIKPRIIISKYPRINIAGDAIEPSGSEDAVLESFTYDAYGIVSFDVQNYPTSGVVEMNGLSGIVTETSPWMALEREIYETDQPNVEP